MSKIREEFERWYATRMYATPFAYRIAEDGYEAGYQAAIAAVREGGATAVLQVGRNPRFLDCIHRGVALPADQFLWPEETRMPSLTLAPLYKLPDDLT